MRADRRSSATPEGRADRLGDVRNIRHRARGWRKRLPAGARLFPARHGAFGGIRVAWPDPRRGFGQPAQTLCRRGEIRIRGWRQTRSGRRALLLPGRLQLQAHGRRAAGRPASLAGSGAGRRDRPRGRVPGGAPLAGRLARGGRGRTRRPAGRSARARPGPPVLRDPPPCDGRHAHRSLPRLREEGRRDRQEFPGVSRGHGVRARQVPDRGGRRAGRQARPLRGGHMAAAL